MELHLLSSYADIIAKSSPMFHRQFVQKHFKTMQESIMKKLFAATPAQMRNIKKENIDEILSSFYNVLLKRIPGSSQSQLNG